MSTKARWKARQDALGIDFKGEILEPHEVRFVERFLAAGHTLDWIPRDTLRYLPTNDFVWLSNGSIIVELKSTKPRYETIRGRIKDSVRAAARHGVIKDSFLIDLGDEPLGDALHTQLRHYNLDRSRYRIRNLWVMSRGQIHEITLLT